MCGIAFFMSPEGVEAYKDDFKRACHYVSHRGPDDYGFEEFDTCLLGFRRLAIIDLSPMGHQPMYDDLHRYCIIFNGEIYNYRDLRAQLENRGVVFRSNSDTEVILKGYIFHGAKIVEMLDGMFAFVIYDRVTHNVFAARDRMGKKPLLYYHENDRIVFCSELKQIMQFSFFRRNINHHALRFYLMYGSVPVPETIFEGVNQVPPGHYVHLRRKELVMTEYWCPTVTGVDGISYVEACQELRDLITKSVKKRLISDVPLGVFLSGGVDSSIITAIMAQFSNEVKTFSVTYNEASEQYDERPYVRLVVERYGTEHSTIAISADDVYNSIEKIIWHMDQPSCDAINTYFVSQSAKKGATVSLSGVGADELFAGYSTFKFASILDRIRPVRRHHAASMSLLSMAFSASPHAWQRDWRVRVIAGVLGAFPSSLNRYDLIKQIYTGSEVNRLCNRQDFNKLDLLGEWFDPKLSEIQKVTLAELNTYMVNTLLRDSDVMGMAHSLEIRCPFVDHKVIEFGLNLPDTYKIKGLTTKRILKDAFSNMLPSEILRRKKMGFAFPLSIWLKKRNLRDLVEDCLSESAVRRRGLFRFHEIQKVKRSYYDLRDTSIRTYQTYQKVWELVVLELWMRRYLDRGRE